MDMMAWLEGLVIGKKVWNKINLADRDKVVEIALERPELSSRELAWHIIDKYSYYISESSVYRILKLNGLITNSFIQDYECL